MRYGLLVLTLLVGLGACQPPQSPAQNAEVLPPEFPAPVREEPAQTDKIVSAQDAQERLIFLSKQDQQFVKTPIGKQNLLQLIAREKLIALAAREEDLHHDPAYKAVLAQKKAQLDKIYQDYAAQTLENLWYEKQHQNGALAVTNEEIETYYKTYPYEMTIKQIIVDNAQTADELLRALKSNRARWKELSRQYNKAPEMLRGEISFMPGEFLPDIEVIAANSATGSVQGFFKTAYGFHIIMKTGEKKLSLENATPRIRAVLENNKLDKLLETLQNKYEVMIDEQNE